MARPKKHNAEYFSHDAGMRNDERIKAVRKKFRSTGYAIYCMLIEYLTGKEFFKFKYDELTIELIAGDFDEDVDLIRDVIEYCVKLDLLQNDEDGFIRCKTLEKRLEPVLQKRKLSKDRVSVTETTQSKVKESKVKESDKYTQYGDGETYISIRPVYVHDKWVRIHELDKFFDHTGQLKMLVKSGMTAFKEFITNNPGREFKDPDHLYSSFKKFCVEGAKVKIVQTKNKDDPFSEAEYNLTQWTADAWKTYYKQQIMTDKKFVDRFKDILT